MSFDLHTLVRDTLAQTKEADPHVIARRLVARIPAEHRDAALAECLGDRVRIEIGRQRMSAFRSAPAAVTSNGTSWRKRAAGLLAQPVNVPEVGWRKLGDCTADDLDALAAEHAKRAAEQEAIAERYRDYARLLRESGAATLSEAGASVLAVAA